MIQLDSTSGGPQGRDSLPEALHNWDVINTDSRDKWRSKATLAPRPHCDRFLYEPFCRLLACQAVRRQIVDLRLEYSLSRKDEQAGAETTSGLQRDPPHPHDAASDGATPSADNLDKCIVYLDSAHTRGIDLKLPVNAPLRQSRLRTIRY